MSSDIANEYWAEAGERAALMSGSREQRLEYQTRSFPIEESLSTRIDEKDPTLIDDLVRIAEAAPDPDALGLFGAGIVWEALYNGGDVQRLADAARSSRAFLAALQAAFAGWDGITPDGKKLLRPLIEE
jgi:hypothetical protein